MFKRCFIATFVVLVLYSIFCVTCVKGSFLIALMVTLPFLGIVTFAVSATICYLFFRPEHKEVAKCEEAIHNHVLRIGTIQILKDRKVI